MGNRAADGERESGKPQVRFVEIHASYGVALVDDKPGDDDARAMATAFVMFSDRAKGVFGPEFRELGAEVFLVLRRDATQAELDGAVRAPKGESK